MKKLLLIISIVAFIFSGCSKKEDTPANVGIVGDWSWLYSKDNKEAGLYMRYDNNNNYYRANDKGFKSIADKGKYSLSNNMLKTKMEVVNEYGEVSYTTEVSQEIEFNGNDEMHYKEDKTFGDREFVSMYLKRIK